MTFSTLSNYLTVYKNLSAIRRGFIFVIFPLFYRFLSPPRLPPPINTTPFSRFDFHFCWRSTPLHNYLFLKEHEFSKMSDFCCFFLCFFCLSSSFHVEKCLLFLLLVYKPTFHIHLFSIVRFLFCCCFLVVLFLQFSTEKKSRVRVSR